MFGENNSLILPRTANEGIKGVPLQPLNFRLAVSCWLYCA